MICFLFFWKDIFSVWNKQAMDTSAYVILACLGQHKRSKISDNCLDFTKQDLK